MRDGDRPHPAHRCHHQSVRRQAKLPALQMVPRSEREGDAATVEAALRDVRHVSAPDSLRLLARGQLDAGGSRILPREAPRGPRASRPQQIEKNVFLSEEEEKKHWKTLENAPKKKHWKTLENAPKKKPLKTLENPAKKKHCKTLENPEKRTLENNGKLYKKNTGKTLENPAKKTLKNAPKKEHWKTLENSPNKKHWKTLKKKNTKKHWKTLQTKSTRKL